MPKKSIPRTGVMDQSLQDWRAIEWASFFQFRLVLPESPTITDVSTNANQDPRIIALAVWFETIRDTSVSGNPVYDGDVEDLDSFADLHFIGQNSVQNIYEFDQDVDAPVSNVRFAVTSVDIDHNGNGLFRIFCISRTGTATPDVAKINAFLDETTATGALGYRVRTAAAGLDRRSTLRRPPVAGRVHVRHQGAGRRPDAARARPGRRGRRRLRHGDWRPVRAVAPILRTPDQCPVSPRRSRFPTASTRSTSRRTRRRTASSKYRTPDVIVPHPGMDRLMSFHNLNATHTMEILDWDGNNVLTLAPGEGDVQLRAILYKDGDGELVGVGPIEREYLLASGNDVSNQFGSGFVDVSTTHYGRPIPLEVAANRTADRFAVEAFARGTDSITNGQTIGALGLRVPEAVEFNKGGRARWEMDLTVTSATSGQMPSNHGLQVFQNGTAFPRFTQRQWGTYDSRHWGGLIETEVELGDVITPFFSYPNSGVTMPVQNMGLFSYRLLIVLALDISIPYTA